MSGSAGQPLEDEYQDIREQMHALRGKEERGYRVVHRMAERADRRLEFALYSEWRNQK
jgi:hypothetical protein